MVDLKLYLTSFMSIGQMVEQEIRGRHSKTRKRLVQDQYDLDLTFITPQIIAMGYPSVWPENVYRNPIEQVRN